MNQPQEETLSSFWRRRRSSDRPLALRDLQVELTYLARLITGNQKVNVGWSKELIDYEPSKRNSYWQEEEARKVIILDAGVLENLDLKQPIPDSIVDVLVGDTIFRANYMKLLDESAYGSINKVLKDIKDGNLGYGYSMNGGGYVTRGNVFLTALEALAKDADIQRTADLITYNRAYFLAQDAPPAVVEYVESSLKWKKEKIQDIWEHLITQCSTQDAYFEDVIDLFSLFMVYRNKLDPRIDKEILRLFVHAQKNIYQLVQRSNPTWADIASQVHDVTKMFSGFSRKPKLGQQPDASGDEETEMEIQGTSSSSDGEGQTSPDGTEKPNEGEEPEGGPDDASNDAENDSNDESSDEGNNNDDSESSDKETESSPDDSESKDSDSEDNGQDEQESDSGEDHDEDQEPENDKDDEESSGSDSESDDSDEDLDDEESEDDFDSGMDDGEDDLDDGQLEDDKPLDVLSQVKAKAEISSMLDAVSLMAEISPEDALAIKEAIEFSREDISSEVAPFLGGRGGETIIWQKASYDFHLEQNLRNEAYKNATGISSILSRFKRMKSRYEHGLSDGSKIDARRLERISYGSSNVFQRRTVIDRLDMALVLLADCSGSVSDQEWALMQKTCASFVQALQGRDDVELIVEGYSTGYGFTGLYRHYDRKLGKMHFVRGSEGGTPSGIALAAIRESIFGRLGITKKDKLIIHLTDGQPDDWDEVKRQIDLNQKARIQTYCILISDYDASDEFRETYGKNFVHLKDFSMLLKSLTDMFSNLVLGR